MLMEPLRRLIRPVVDFVYPPVCLLCDGDLGPGQSAVCSGCWNSFHRISPDHPVWCEIRDKLCGDGVVEDIYSCYLFEKDGALQNAVHLLKYRGIRSVGVRLGEEIGRGCAAWWSGGRPDLLIPVPLHKRKKRERGYNQSDLLAQGVSGTAGVPVAAGLLRRSRYTESQTLLGLGERRENVEGAFSLAGAGRPGLAGRSVLLIDDVITTGSTLRACAAVLRRGGAEHVCAASAALAQ
ncbi:MAG TPA: ComF family protein [Bacteroidota bacterium]|nr:ComF family protein [Bacteroidota bacterium]